MVFIEVERKIERNSTKQTFSSNCLCDRPTPEISWQKDGGELPSSRMSFHNFQKTLKISDVNEADAGDYRCTATNSLGIAYHIIKVTVKGEELAQLLSCLTLVMQCEAIPLFWYNRISC